MKVKAILEEQFKDLISEDTLNVIEQAFQQAVDEKVSEKVKAETEKFNEHVELERESISQKLDEEYTEKLKTVVQKIDEDHTEKLNTLIEKIDADHSAKLEKLLEAIDTDHAVKLQKVVKSIDVKHAEMLKQVVEKYETQLNEEAKSFQEKVVEEISNYIDLYLDKTIPKDQISEAVENIRAQKQIQEIRKIVGISEEFVDSEIKEALVDGKKTIDSLREELNSALKENVEINQQLKKAQSTILLEAKTTDMQASKKQFIHKLLKNKTPEYIEENFNYVVEMFDKEAEQEVETAQKEVLSESSVLSSKIDRPEITEAETNFNFNNEIERDTEKVESVSGYLNEMKKISGQRFTR